VTYIDAKGRRVTTENSYLTPDVFSRKNLTVAVGATVTRVLFDAPADGSEPRATGVEFARAPNGPRYRARARKEVVLSYAFAYMLFGVLLNKPVEPARYTHRT
jgi:choline dehydrogenase